MEAPKAPAPAKDHVDDGHLPRPRFPGSPFAESPLAWCLPGEAGFCSRAAGDRPTEALASNAKPRVLGAISSRASG
jgi:hypothetical protein